MVCSRGKAILQYFFLRHVSTTLSYIATASVRHTEALMATTRRKAWIFHFFLLLNYSYHASSARDVRVGTDHHDQNVQQYYSVKVEATMPVVTMSPPEGNTTFLGGTTWCVALPGVAEAELQRALDWACGQGSADCSHLQPGGECFEPNTLVSHASFAFNSYYQQNGNSDIACNFGGAAAITTHNPGYGSCNYPTSSDPDSSAYLHGPIPSWWGVIGVMLLLYF